MHFNNATVEIHLDHGEGIRREVGEDEHEVRLFSNGVQRSAAIGGAERSTRERPHRVVDRSAMESDVVGLRNRRKRVNDIPSLIATRAQGHAEPQERATLQALNTDRDRQSYSRKLVMGPTSGELGDDAPRFRRVVKFVMLMMRCVWCRCG